MCKDNMEKPEEKMHHHHHDGAHHGPHHGPHGGPHGCKGKKKEFLKSLDPDSLSAKFAQTARKFMHSSEDDIKNGAAFAELTDAEKTELEAILAKMSASIKVEKHPKPEEQPEAASDETANA